ncbi:MAG: archaeal proteasome endopeptidase complex subunit beta [Promethearchaeati archaeon SRVP18_Atabeyarchaeia-1]
MNLPSDAAQQQIEIPLGATTIGLVCKDGVVLASERRVAWGTFVLSKAGKKVFKIADKIGVACAGLMSDMQVLARTMGAQAALYLLDMRRPMPVKAAAKLLSNILFERRGSPLFTQTIIAGVDDGGPRMFILDLLGSLIEDKYAAVGSGAQVAIGVLEAEYKESITVEQGKEIVIRAIRSAIERDAASGNGVDILTITKSETSEISESLK